MKGICCSCQTAHNLKPLHGNVIDFERNGNNIADDYVMDHHRINKDETGPICEGEGTTPQAIVKE